MIYCGIKLSSQSHNTSVFIDRGSLVRLEALLMLVTMQTVWSVFKQS